MFARVLEEKDNTLINNLISSRNALALVIACFLCAGIGLIPDARAQNPARELLTQKTRKRLSRIIEQSPSIIGLTAVDLTSNEAVFSFNPDIVFPQASAIKIPILMEVYKQARQGKFALTDKRSIHQEDIVGGTGILKNMKGDLSLSIQNLCVLMITLSDNTATNLLIDLVGMAEINSTMQDIGAGKTRLQRKMMDIEASAGNRENISTPANAAMILQGLYHGAFFSKEITSEVISLLGRVPREESMLAAGVPDTVSMAFKPGGLKGVSTEWAIIQLKERPYAIALMESYRSDSRGEKRTEKISKVLYEYFWKMGNATRFGVFRDPALMTSFHHWFIRTGYEYYAENGF